MNPGKLGVVRLVTFSPEIDEHAVLPGLCVRHSTRAQIDHTLCG